MDEECKKKLDDYAEKAAIMMIMGFIIGAIWGIVNGIFIAQILT